jgi:RNA polymerase sigma-70 factor (ECF subfamily)
VVREEKGRVEEREAFAREAMTHLDQLYRVAFHLVKDPDQSQELVQETYARALDSFTQFTPGTNMKAWLTRILYNYFYDQYHQNRKWVSAEETGRETGSDIGFWERSAGNDPGPEAIVLHRELAEKVREALEKIPDEFRVPIVLVDMGEFSYAETADILACPIGTVRSRLSRGRRLLHNILKDYVGRENPEH